MTSNGDLRVKDIIRQLADDILVKVWVFIFAAVLAASGRFFVNLVVE